MTTSKWRRNDLGHQTTYVMSLENQQEKRRRKRKGKVVDQVVVVVEHFMQKSLRENRTSQSLLSRLKVKKLNTASILKFCSKICYFVDLLADTFIMLSPSLLICVEKNISPTST